MPETARAAATVSRAQRLRAAGLALSCAVAFSPVLVDLARYLGAVDGRLAILLAPLLVVVATRAQRAPASLRPRTGYALVAAGLALQLAGIGLASSTLARLGLPVAAVGIGCLLGRPGPAQLALLFFAVPIPISITSITTPWLDSRYAELAVLVPNGVFGARLVASGPLILSGTDRLELYASDSGLWLASVLASLGWLAGLLHGRSFGGRVRAALFAALWAVPGQLVGVMIAGALLAAGSPGAARAWLDWGLHAAAMLCFALALGRRSRAGSRRASH